MKNIIVDRNSYWQMTFDPKGQTFQRQAVQHPFLAVCDSHTRHLLEDIGIDAARTANGGIVLLEDAKSVRKNRGTGQMTRPYRKSASAQA